MQTTTTIQGCSGYQLCFRSLIDQQQSMVFDCDERGVVDMDSLDRRARLNYLYAHTLIGREFARPAVQPMVH